MVVGRSPSDWRQIAARPVDRWYVGVDLGQSTDPTAISVMNHRAIPLDEWTMNEKAQTWKQQKTEHFDVRHLERLPLGMPYPQQNPARGRLARAAAIEFVQAQAGHR